MSEQTQIVDAQFALYENEDGQPMLKIDCRDGEIWMTQSDMATLFEVNVATINEHVKNIYESGELDESPTIRNSLIVQKEGSRDVKRNINSYHLDLIISVGYRVNSRRGTHFRRWATQRLSEYVITGAAIDEDRFSSGGKDFDAVLDRVRAIRTSEKHLYQKVKDVFSLSIDYDSGSEASHHFFATVQNKLHFAILGNTAAEMIVKRIDSKDDHLGLTNWRGNSITKAEAETAKNYMSPVELKRLELLAEQFLSFAELRALEQQPMRMIDWQTKLDDFLRLNDKDILEGLGKVSRKDMLEKVETEFGRFNRAALNGKVRGSKGSTSKSKGAQIIPYGQD